MKQPVLILSIFIHILLIVTVVFCIPSSPSTESDTQENINKEIKVISSTNQVYQNGSFMYSFELDNGNREQIEGYLKTVDNEQIYSITGEYSFEAPNGETHTVQFIADENGFQVLSYEKRAPIAIYINPKAIASIVG